MAIGLAQYAYGRKGLTNDVANPLPRERRPLVIAIAAAGVVAVAALALTGLIPADRLSTIVVVLSIVAAVAYFAVILRSHRIDGTERRRVLAFIPMFLVSAVFWSLYQQQFTVVTVYSDQRLDRDLFGWTMPVSWVQSINPVFIIILSGVFTALWSRLGSRQPSTPIKFGLGTIVMGVAFLLFLPLAGGGPNSAPLIGLAGILFVFTVAELLLSPVGLSLATRLAPEAFRTQMVALFLPLGGPGHGHVGHAGRLLQRGHRDRLLRHPRRHRHHGRRDRGGPELVAAPPHGRGALALAAGPLPVNLG